MEYKVLVCGYSRELKNLKSGWFESLDNLANQLNKEAREGWKVREIIPTSASFGIVYTVLLERDKYTKFKEPEK